MEKINIVIIGGGFGGVAVAKKLAIFAKLRPELCITLISRSKVSLFTPLLHEVATGSLRPDGVGESLAEIFKGTAVKLIFDSVQSVDVDERQVTTERGKQFGYDYLVLATGAKPNFFNTPGAEQFCHTLKTLEDAIELKKAIVASAEVVKKGVAPCVTIIGGGPTGVELAVELSYFYRGTLFPKFAQEDLKPNITIIQKAPELIPMFPERFRVLAKERLEKLGVTVLLSKGVKEIFSNVVVTDDGTTFPSVLTVWTAGVQSDIPPIAGWTAPAPLAGGRLPVLQTLQLIDSPNIFVLGDIAAFTNPGEKGPVPQLAQVATRQGPVVARNIMALIDGKPLENYHFISVGLLMSVGEWMAIAQVKSLFLSGKVAWVLWRAIYLSKIETLPDKCRVLFDWSRNLFLQRRS